MTNVIATVAQSLAVARMTFLLLYEPRDRVCAAGLWLWLVVDALVRGAAA
jgi:hypothetical protein